MCGVFHIAYGFWRLSLLFTYQYFISFYCLIVLCCTKTPCFPCASDSQVYLDCLSVSAAVNTAQCASHASLWNHILIYLADTCERGFWAAHKVYVWCFKNLPSCLPMWLHHFTSPPAREEASVTTSGCPLSLGSGHPCGGVAFLIIGPSGTWDSLGDFSFCSHLKVKQCSVDPLTVTLPQWPWAVLAASALNLPTPTQTDLF